MISNSTFRKGRSKGFYILISLVLILTSFMFVRGLFTSKVTREIKMELVKSPLFFQTTRYLMETTYCFNREFKKFMGIVGYGGAIACFKTIGEVIGGIDLHNVELRSNIDYFKNLIDPFYEKYLEIKIPIPEVVSVNLISVEMLFSRKWRNFSFNEKTNFIKVIEREMKKSAVDMGILKDTIDHFKKYVRSISLRYGVNVIVHSPVSSQ